MKPLGTLKYHRTGCQSIEFARSYDMVKEGGSTDETNEDEDEDEMNRDDEMNRARWLAGGGKDHRVSIWALMNFDKG